LEDKKIQRELAFFIVKQIYFVDYFWRSRKITISTEKAFTKVKALFYSCGLVNFIESDACSLDIAYPFCNTLQDIHQWLSKTC